VRQSGLIRPDIVSRVRQPLKPSLNVIGLLLRSTSGFILLESSRRSITHLTIRDASSRCSADHYIHPIGRSSTSIFAKSRRCAFDKSSFGTVGLPVAASGAVLMLAIYSGTVYYAVVLGAFCGVTLSPFAHLPAATLILVTISTFNSVVSGFRRYQELR
jgi:hypothetical protein